MVLAVEANPPVYTNYLTRTADAFALVRRLGSPGLAVNLDLSTVLANSERLRDFIADLDLVSHVHISERAWRRSAAALSTPSWPPC